MRSRTSSSRSTFGAGGRPRAACRCRSTNAGDIRPMEYPAGFKYTNEHEWIDIDGDRGRVGITDYAQPQLGPVVYIALPDIGTKLKAGQSFGTIESGRAVSELYAPVSGEVVDVNSTLKTKPE